MGRTTGPGAHPRNSPDIQGQQEPQERSQKAFGSAHLAEADLAIPDENSSMVHVPRTSYRPQTAQLASPSTSESRSGVFGTGSCSTPSTWDSPGFAEDLFHTPAHTPMTLCEPASQDQREVDLNMSQRRSSASVQSAQTGDATQNPQSMIQLPLDTGFEMYSAENFVEATCEMNFYGWESNNAFGVGGESGFLPQGHSPWNPGVFV